MAMNICIITLLGTLIIGLTIYYLTSNNLALKNYKEFIERYGHKLEEYDVTTEDGYIINLWHLNPKFDVNSEKVIFLQTGFVCTGILFLN